MTGENTPRNNTDDPMEQAVREVFRRQADRLTVPALPKQDLVDHRPIPRRLVLAAASVVVVVGTGLSLLAGLVGDPNAIITDGTRNTDSADSTDNAQSTDNAATSEETPELDASPSDPADADTDPEEAATTEENGSVEDAQVVVTVAEDPNTWLLADPDRWLMVSHRVVQEPIEQAVPGSSVHVYELETGEFFILAVLPVPSEEDSQTIDQAGAPEIRLNAEPETGRVAASWETDGHELTLVGFDAAEQVVVEFARSLDLESGSWEVDGAVLRRSEAAQPVGQSSPPVSGPVIEVEYVPLGRDGRPVLSGRVIQRTRQGFPVDLYDRMLGDGGIGTLKIRSVAGADGAQVTGLGIEFGVRFSDGWLTTWDNEGGEPMVAQLLDDVGLVDEERWRTAVQASVTAQSAAVESAAAEFGTIPSPELARLALPDTYQLVAVRDPSQWSDGERAQYEVAAEAERAQLQQVIVWAQSFRKVGNADSILPDVMVEVHDVRIRFPTSAGDEDRPFRFDGFDGLYGPHSQGTAGLMMERGDLRIQLFSPTLSPDELADFVRSAGLRSDGTRGLADTSGFELTAEGSLAFQDQAGWPSWETEWSRGPDETVYISFHRQPSELANVMIDLHATWLAYPGQPMERPMSGERLLHVDTGQDPQVIWARPDLGGLVTIFGPGAVEAAEALERIDQDEWSALVAPVLDPPPDGPGN